MCELLELCVPLCVCMIRTCQFGLMGLACIFDMIDKCCIKPCCPNCCREKKKAISQEDVRDDMVDGAWGEPDSQPKPQSNSLLVPPSIDESSRENKPNMDVGWNDSPRQQEQNQMISGWDSTTLNLEQPCSNERISPSNSTATDLVAPTAPLVSENTSLHQTNASETDILVVHAPNIQSSVNYTPESFRPLTPPPTYEESQSHGIDS